MGTEDEFVNPLAHLGEMDQAGIVLHEMYRSLRSGGFNMVEACIVVGAAIALSNGPGTETDPNTGP